jgi:nicotinamide phosphoribosyltransferase
MKTRIRQLTEQEKRSLGEQQMIADWLQIFPKGILSIVADTFDLWKLITEYLPANKEAITARDGKLVIRPNSGDPVDIICGRYQNKAANKLAGMGDTSTFEAYQKAYDGQGEFKTEAEFKGVIELLWDIFGGTINEQGYKVLDSHIGAIYGDSITPERQVQIYERLAAKGFAATNIVLGIGSFTYQYNTRDTLGFAAKGAWFEVEEDHGPMGNGKVKLAYNIYKDPVTDDGTKKSLKGLCMVYEEDSDGSQKWNVKTECTWEEENEGVLQTIYEDGNFYNQATLEEIRERLNRI